MILPNVVVGSSDDRRLLPLIQVRLHGPRRSAPLTALVDSGAEQNVLDEELANFVGISPDDAEPVVIVGTGDDHLPGLRTGIELQLGRHRWTAPTIFCRDLNREGILGQAGFFAYFNVTFRYAREDMIIRRVKN